MPCVGYRMRPAEYQRDFSTFATNRPFKLTHPLTQWSLRHFQSLVDDRFREMSQILGGSGREPAHHCVHRCSSEPPRSY